MDIFQPHMQWAHKETGKIIFEMKRKYNEHYGGEGMYYLFKIHNDNFPTETEKEEFMANAFKAIALMAAMTNIALFDVEEMGEKMQEKAQAILDTGVNLEEQQVDVTLDLMNHAIDEVQQLTIGVSTKPAAELTKPPVKLEKE